MQKSIITLDRSDWGFVIVCEEHPYWAAFRFLEPDAQDVACRHEADYHPGVYHQRDAAYQRVRHAARRAEITKAG
jgi:hypothetical protein